eukprot:1835470-Karenia_brevis.AAC.1
MTEVSQQRSHEQYVADENRRMCDDDNHDPWLKDEDLDFRVHRCRMSHIASQPGSGGLPTPEEMLLQSALPR